MDVNAIADQRWNSQTSNWMMSSTQYRGGTLGYYNWFSSVVHYLPYENVLQNTQYLDVFFTPYNRIVKKNRKLSLLDFGWLLWNVWDLPLSIHNICLHIQAAMTIVIQIWPDHKSATQRRRHLLSTRCVQILVTVSGNR